MIRGASEQGRRIYWRTVIILALILAVVTSGGFHVLYRMSVNDTKLQLIELAQSQARLMESVGKFDAFFQSAGAPGAGRSATLSQFKEGHRSFQGFGETGEIMLAERQGDEIIFLLPARNLGYQLPPPVNITEDEAGPMKAALSGRSGIVIDRDYTGERVLAAYEWMPFMEMGMVVKIDMAEVKGPFWRAAALTAGLALLATLLGAALNGRAVSPLIEQIVLDNDIIKQREASYRQLVETIPGVVYQATVEHPLVMLELSASVELLTGYPAETFGEDGVRRFVDLVARDDRTILAVERPGPFTLEYRIHRADGEVRWVADHGSIAEDPTGQLRRNGIMLDITARKAAERQLKELQGKLSRYISPQVYKSIFQGRQDAKVGNTRKKLTVFFSDVVNFTVKSESLDPDDLTTIVNSYLNRMSELAVKHGGTLDKFIGDGVMIFFGDPESQGVQQDARMAVDMALAMLDEVEALNQAALREGINSPIQIRIGIATGFCTVGNFGSESRMDYTVFGKTVNLAARLESAAPPQGILVAEETALLIRDEFECEAAAAVTVKGFAEPVPVHRVVGRR